MNAKTTTVVLESVIGKREFDIEHANRLLAMKLNGGWHLPSDSEFTYTEGNGIEHRGNKKKDKGAEEEISNKQSSLSPK